MDMFFGSQGEITPAATQQQNPAQQNPATQQAQADAASGTPAAFSGNAQDPNAVAPTPMADFKDLWKNDPNAPNAQDPNAPLFSIDQEKLKQHVGSMEFAPQISAEHLQKIMQGDVATLYKALNATAQNGFLKTMEAVQHMVTHGSQTTMQRMENSLPNKFKNFQVNETLSATPLFNDEALKPITEKLQQQFQLKYPQASANDVAKMVTKFMESTANAINPNSGQNQGTNVNGHEQHKVPGNTDFSSFFGG